jgi:hypothetical protein
MRKLTPRRRPSPSLVISILALVMATAGTATAARTLINSTTQIKNGVVSSSDIKDGGVGRKDLAANAVAGDKVRNGTIAIEDLEGPARQAIQASETQALEAFRKDGPLTQEPDKLVRVATLSNIPAGTYAIFATTILTPDASNTGLFDQGRTISGHCVLDAGGDKADGRAFLGSPGGLSPGTISAQITRSFGSTGTAGLDCTVTPTRWRATDTSIIAIRVGQAPRQPVDG